MKRTNEVFRPSVGTEIVAGGGVRFRAWAPLASTLSVRVAGAPGPVPMTRGEGDVFEAFVPEAGPGSDYRYVIGDRERPDPVSRSQPSGVHGPSRVVDPEAFAWTDAAWRGIPLRDLVIYELHVGTFTPEGTFDGVAGRLRHLRDLGVNAIELMPVAEFPGGRNWGYDGAHPYAPQSTYGGPDGLRRLVDACHREGIAVLLDVVYNHLGPEGCYLAELAPFFTDRYRTPWGHALNFDGPGSDGVRRYFIENALHWLVEHHVDGLRLDAIHGIYDFGALHVLRELGSAFHAEAERAGRVAHLVAESDLDDVRVIEPIERGGHGLDAQWSDDFHHAVHAALTGAKHGYFSDFGALADVKKALVEGFVFDGRYSAHRQRRHGSSSKDRPGEQLVVCTQNHDQIANGSAGMRHGTLLSFALQKVAAVVLLTAPNVPMLFMGQEYGETMPFQYFTSHTDPALADAVRRGRSEELAASGLAREASDPQAVATFERSKLDWTLASRSGHAELLRLHTDLLGLRRAHACLRNGRKDLVSVEISEERRWMIIQRGDPDGSAALLLVNLADETRRLPLLGTVGPRWALALDTAAAGYGGPPRSDELARLLDTQGGAVADLLLPASSAALYVREGAR